jgi:hypothetical protein
MTTFNQFVRSTNAAVNRLQRAAERRAREAAKLQRLRLKEEQKATAAQAVKQYNELIATLITVHKEPVETIDWQDILNEQPPAEPIAGHLHEQKAAEKARRYRPGLFDKLFRLSEKKKAGLERKTVLAREKDQEEYIKAGEQYTRELSEWTQLHDLAQQVLNKNPKAYKDAFEKFPPFNETMHFGAKLNFQFEPGHAQVNLEAQTGGIVPKFSLALTSTGKLSKKNLPLGRYNELYQDYICSYLLRTARETLGLLPLEYLIIHAQADLLDPSTGRVQPQTIVSALIYPETLMKLNFDQLDPSDAMKNFKHNMQFNKTTGFNPVDKIVHKPN